MGTMSGGPCTHYDCSNRNSFGYCKTTVCINEHYQQEQLGSPSTTNKSESAVIKQQTNADRIREMSDEELADFLDSIGDGCEWCADQEMCHLMYDTKFSCKDCILQWLKQGVQSEYTGTEI